MALINSDRASADAKVRDPTTWTILQQDGLITSDCVQSCRHDAADRLRARGQRAAAAARGAALRSENTCLSSTCRRLSLRGPLPFLTLGGFESIWIFPTGSYFFSSSSECHKLHEICPSFSAFLKQTKRPCRDSPAGRGSAAVGRAFADPWHHRHCGLRLCHTGPPPAARLMRCHAAAQVDLDRVLIISSALALWSPRSPSCSSLLRAARPLSARSRRPEPYPSEPPFALSATARCRFRTF